MRWFIKECKKCLGTLVMPDDSKVADCINCGQAHVLKQGKEEPYFSMLESAKL